MKNLILVFCLMMAIGAHGQKKMLVETQEEVEPLAVKDLDMAMEGPEGELYLFAQENNVKGSYTFKLSLGEKGRVTSIYVVERSGGDIPTQNKVKDAVKAVRLSFKLPKGKYYKIQYTFEF